MNWEALNFVPKLKPLFTWLKSVYSEPDGTGSSTRVHIAILLAFVVGVGISFGVSVHKHVITIEQFNSFLGAAGGFIFTGCGSLYGLNKVGSIFGKDKPDPPQ